MHIEPIDPRCSVRRRWCWSIPTASCRSGGQRFFDEGKGLVHETWEAFARDIHFARPNRIAYAILDSRLFEIDGFERAIRSDVRPYQSERSKIGGPDRMPAASLRRTIDAFNAAGPAMCLASMPRAAMDWRRWTDAGKSN